MNRIQILFVVLALVSTAPLSRAQDSPPSSRGAGHRVIFEVTMEGEEQWTAVLNNADNLRKSLGADTKIEIVGHSKGLGMLVAMKNKLSERMKKMSDDGIVFAACENTMKKKNVTKDQLLPFATTTDSGVAEVVRKQEAGWSYVKSGV